MTEGSKKEKKDRKKVLGEKGRRKRRSEKMSSK